MIEVICARTYFAAGLCSMPEYLQLLDHEQELQRKGPRENIQHTKVQLLWVKRLQIPKSIATQIQKLSEMQSVMKKYDG